MIQFDITKPGNTYHMTGCEVDILPSVRALNDEV